MLAHRERLASVFGANLKAEGSSRIGLPRDLAKGSVIIRPVPVLLDHGSLQLPLGGTRVNLCEAVLMMTTPKSHRDRWAL